MKKFIWEEEKRGVIACLILIIFGAIVFYYLYDKQREIDNNLGITKGKIISYKMGAPQSGMRAEYEYIVNGVKYKGIAASGGLKKYIDYNKEYTIEYSTKDPSNSRIIINGKRYARGVD